MREFCRGRAGKGKGLVGGSLGQKAEGDVHLGNQVLDDPAISLLGNSRSNGQMGNGYAAVEAK